MLRILQVSSYGADHPGGLEACAEMLALHLPNHDCGVTWAFGAARHRRSTANRVAYRVNNFLEDRTGLPIPLPMFSAWRKLFRLVRSCDVALVHDFMYLSSVITLLYCLLLHKPLVLIVHVWKVPCRRVILNLLQSIAHFVFGRVALQFAAVVITYNRKHLEQIRRQRKGPTFFLANGIHINSTQGHETMERCSADHDRELRVCFAGRCVEKKGLHIVREAAEAFPRVQFIIAGKGPIDPARWNLANVHCLGWIDREALASVFRKCDLLLLPSRGEGFPLIIQEAMYAGLPCAIFEETWAAWGQDRSNFHILSNETYLKEMKRVLEQRISIQRRQELSNYALTNWDWNRTASLYSKILHDCHVSPKSLAGAWPSTWPIEIGVLNPIDRPTAMSN
jgi:starch synthase